MKTGLVLTAALALTGAPALAAAPGVVVKGEASSGLGSDQAPLSGARVAVYQADGRGGRLLAAAVADARGRFQVRLTPDPDGGALYAVARTGADVRLMALMGGEAPDRLVINEMTTVASAYALAQVFRDGLVIPDRPRLPVQTAVGMAHDLVSVETGRPSELMKASPNADETNAWRLLGTLSNLLAPCARGHVEVCDQLFDLAATPDDGRPGDTLQAMVAIARHPAHNLRPLFQLAQAFDVYGPHLDPVRQGPQARNEQMRLDAFTLAIKLNATGRTDPQTGEELCPFGGPANVAFDLNGYLWISNNVVQGDVVSAHCMVVLEPDGRPADGAGGAVSSPVLGGGVLGQGFGLGFAPDGTLWAGNFGWGGEDPVDAQGNPGGSVSHFTGAGQPLSPDWGLTSSLFKVQGTVSDRQGNIWLSSFGNNRVQVFPGGDADTGLPPYESAGSLPFDIRLDGAGEAWVSYNGTSTLAKLALTDGGVVQRLSVQVGSVPGAKAPAHITGGPKGIAVDSHGNVWVAHGDDNAVYEVDASGAVRGKFAGGGVDGPWGVSTDAEGKVWVANFGPLGPWDGKPRISELCGAGACPKGLRPGDPISPATGWTLPSGGEEVRLHDGNPLYFPLKVKSFKPLERLTSVNIDAAGNVWAANNWKPSWAIDLTKNPGGDGMVVFVGLAAPVQPVLYSAPPRSPFTQ